ncbi:carbon storage regulator [Desulforamulus profundi]|uniref:Translational regulator CsrA n=1 Tax=Desulforamulus profundi TaxID=1383067 RepID=A0A2C6MI12_9FIRM|nr:carbon storage regulator CsrA [Desulforamulus profundi]PHJ39066.1 carbon storage regulator [Desulforamulus profundi]
MLILSRKKHEAIHIGDDIIITVLDISGDHIKIGIDAPKNIQIYRAEILKAIQQENKQAALTKAAVQDLVKLMNHDKGEK